MGNYTEKYLKLKLKKLIYWNHSKRFVFTPKISGLY